MQKYSVLFELQNETITILIRIINACHITPNSLPTETNDSIALSKCS
jgi:hypothetical protein